MVPTNITHHRPKHKVRECTAQELVRAISYDPSWAKNLTEPLRITTFANLNQSKITHLSPHLIFCGKNKDGYVATFDSCKSLQVPLGQYHGGTSFKNSGITHIPDSKKLFQILSVARGGMASNFEGCQNLKEATGHYPGGVDFSRSGVETIVSLVVDGAWENHNGLRGFSASFFGCQNLKEGAGTYAQAVDFSASNIEYLNPEFLKIHRPNSDNVALLLAGCQHFKKLTGHYPGAICLDNSGVQEIANLNIETPNLKSTKKMTGHPTKLSLKNCTRLQSIPMGFNESNIICEPELMKKLLRKQKLVKEVNHQRLTETFDV
jgi:hypothetical protein